MSHTRTMLQGSASNVARLVLSMLVALVLPPLFVHRMAPSEYAAWVLILQTTGYVNLLDLGLQTAIGKFVAQYDAHGNGVASGRILSTSLAILSASAIVGAVAIGFVVWRVPQLFNQMPANLVSDLREGILLVGLSFVVALPFGAFLATFTGLQMYGFPTGAALGSKLLTSAALAALVFLHCGIVQLAATLAVCNIATAVVQFLGWKKYINRRVNLSLRLVDRQSALLLMKFSGTLLIWTIATLFVSGLDMIIVGHYDFKNTGYYGIAASVTNFMMLVIGGLFGPLVPAVSSLQAERTPLQLGNMVIRTTRYCTLLTCLFGLPLLVEAYPLLKLWVGEAYAVRSALFLQVLVLGNVIRQLGYPYSLVVVAIGRQHLATWATVAEAAVNVSLSIYLVNRIGAVGVAVGTLVGAFVSVGMNLVISMKLTSSAIFISRRHFISEGLLRPLLCSVPSIICLLGWKDSLGAAPLGPWRILAWSGSTLWVAWFAALNTNERQAITRACSRLVYDLR